MILLFHARKMDHVFGTIWINFSHQNSIVIVNYIPENTDFSDFSSFSDFLEIS